MSPDDLEDEFGSNVTCVLIQRYCLRPAIDGSIVGIVFNESKGEPIRIGIPHDGLSEFIARLMAVELEMEERRNAARH